LIVEPPDGSWVVAENFGGMVAEIYTGPAAEWVTIGHPRFATFDDAKAWIDADCPGGLGEQIDEAEDPNDPDLGPPGERGFGPR